MELTTVNSLKIRNRGNLPMQMESYSITIRLFKRAILRSKVNKVTDIRRRIDKIQNHKN